MERSVALKKLGRILGKTFRYRIDTGAPNPDDRREAAARLAVERPKRDDLGKQMEARRAAVLDADADYQRLKSAHEESKKLCNELMGIGLRHRITVGTVPGGLFFHVKAEGDSWEDVIAKIKSGKVA